MFGVKQRENIYSKKLTVKVVFFFSSLFFLCLKLLCSTKIVIGTTERRNEVEQSDRERRSSLFEKETSFSMPDAAVSYLL